MKNKLKQDEQFWASKAIEWKKESFAGLLYAPWIHEEIVSCTDHSLETVFFLLILNSVNEYNIYVYYLVYSEADASSVMMCRVTADKMYFRFPVRCAENLWDEEQWGEEYTKESIPRSYFSDRLSNMFERLNSIVPRIKKITNP